MLSCNQSCWACHVPPVCAWMCWLFWLWAGMAVLILVWWVPKGVQLLPKKHHLALHGLPDPGTVFEAGLKSLWCLIRSYVEQKWAERGFTDRVLVGSRLMGVLMGKHSIPACWNSNEGIYGPSLIYSWWLKSFFPQTCISTHSRHLLGVHYMPTSILVLNLNAN